MAEKGKNWPFTISYTVESRYLDLSGKSEKVRVIGGWVIEGKISEKMAWRGIEKESS